MRMDWLTPNNISPILNEAMAKYEINTLLPAAAFLEQIAHESDELKYYEAAKMTLGLTTNEDKGENVGISRRISGNKKHIENPPIDVRLEYVVVPTLSHFALYHLRRPMEKSSRTIERPVKRYGGGERPIAPKSGWPLLLFSHHRGKRPIPDTDTIRIFHVSWR
jgi:hypothetical protein